MSETIVSDPETAPMRDGQHLPCSREQGKNGRRRPNRGRKSVSYQRSRIRQSCIRRKRSKNSRAGKKADQKGKTDDAIWHIMRRPISLAPTFYMARNNLGTLYLGKAQLCGGAGAVRKSNRNLIPNDASAYFNLANLYLLENTVRRRTRSGREGSLVSNQIRHLVISCRAHCYARAGNTLEAEKSLRRSSNLIPQMAQTHLALVNLFLQEKRAF